MATTIRIGHASISENSTANGSAGDQTGREVYINDNYNIASLNPNIVLRPKTSSLAELSAKACEAGCLNDNIGYSQHGSVNRNSLYNQAVAVGYDLSKVTTKCNTDCSAFMTVCAIAGGSKISYGTNAPTTSNMRTRFKQSGDYTVLTDAKHTTKTDYLKRGDILVHEGSHTVMVLGNGGNVLEDDTLEPENPSVITPVTIIRVRTINVNIENITANTAKAIIKVTEQKTGAAATIMSTSNINKYKWSYILEPVGGEANTKQFLISSGQATLSLTDLTPNNSYMLRIIAVKQDESEEFCSQKILFTTSPAKPASGRTSHIFKCKASNVVDNIYVKTNNEFMPVMAYTNIQGVD